MNWSCAVGFDVRERERRYGIVHIASTFSVLQERKKKEGKNAENAASFIRKHQNTCAHRFVDSSLSRACLLHRLLQLTSGIRVRLHPWHDVTPHKS